MQVRKRLNTLISLTYIGATLTWASGIAGGILLTLCWLGCLSPAASLRLWVTAVLVGGLSGLLWSRTKHLNLYDSAQWLDDRLDDHETLSAALVCMEHHADEAFDGMIVAKAIQLLQAKHRIKWPHRRALIWSVGSLLAITVITMLFSFWPSDIRPVELRATRDPITNALHVKPAKHAEERSMDQTTKKMAERLFPHNPKMARRMEKALEQGDTAELEKLLKDAKWDTDLMANRETAPAENPKAQAEQEMQQKMLQMVKGINLSNHNKAQGKKKGKTEGSQQAAGANGNSEQTRKKSSDVRSGNTERFIPGSNKDKMEGERRAQMSDAGQGRRSQAGKGESTVGKRWGNLDGQTSSQTALITSKKNSPMLEYVMPKKGAQIPLSEALPQAGRSAESAMVRESLPGEYKSFVRSYFLRLTKAAGSGKSKKK